MGTQTETAARTEDAPLAEAPNNGALVQSDNAERDEAKESNKKAGAAFLEDVFSGQRVNEIAAALSNAMPIEAFKASVSSAVMNNPDLINCKPGLLFREVIRIARLGLAFDQQLGEAFLIAAWNKDSRKKDMPQARVGYRGLMKLARNEGVQMYAHEVRANDEFECILGIEHKLVHKPKVFATDRGDVIGFYAVAKLKDAEPDFEPMSQAEVDAIRDRTEAYKAFLNKKIQSTPWSTDPVEMGKKTVIRRLCKRLPMGPKMSAAIAIEDDAEGVVPRQEREPSRQPSDNGTKALDGFAGRGRPRRAVTDVVPEGDKGGGLPLTGGGTKPKDAKPAAKDAAAKSGEKLGEILDGLPGESNRPRDQIIADHERDVRENGGGTYGEAYVEPEDGPSLESADHPGNDAGAKDDEPSDEEKRHAELLALAPAMPADAAEDWERNGQWMKGWKWINEAMRNVEDVEVRQALATEHRLLLIAVMGKSDGYKKAAAAFLSSNGVKIEDGQ